MDLKATYDKIAKDWHKDHQPDTWWMPGVDKFASLVGPSKLILDVGCGTGIKSKYLIDKGLKVIGIDFSQEMIDIAKREVPEGEFLVMDMDNISTLTNTFDGIFVHSSLLHTKKNLVHNVLDGLLKKLKSGGYFYVAVKKKQPDGPDEEMVKENDYGYEYERFFSYFTVEEIKEHFSRLGVKFIYQADTSGIQMIGQK